MQLGDFIKSSGLGAKFQTDEVKLIIDDEKLIIKTSDKTYEISYEAREI